MKRLAILATIALSGCAIFGRGEQPTDIRAGGYTWYLASPAYRMRALQWNHIAEDGRLPSAMTRVRNLCGMHWSWNGSACTLRIRESGLCLVFSVYSIQQAAEIPERDGDSLLSHELRHCGASMPGAGAWNHRE